MGVLSKLIISASGEVGPGKGHEQIKKWVVNNGGKWVPLATKGITHLICSKEHWMKREGVDSVQIAQLSGAHVVSYDWLEDSLQGRRKLAERKYTWMEIGKERKKKKQFLKMGKMVDELKFNKGCALAREETRSGTSKHASSCAARASSGRASGGFFISSLDELSRRRQAREAKRKEYKGDAKTENSIPSSQHEVAAEEGSMPVPTLSPPCMPFAPKSVALSRKIKAPACKALLATEKLTDNYHIYLDSTGFEYTLRLLRTNLHQNTFAQYQLRLYESNTKPYVYCMFIRYSPPAPTLLQLGVTPGQETDVDTENNSQGSGNSTGLHPELTRAMAAMQPAPRPSAEEPYRALLSPLNSSYNEAFGTFRAIFKELTFLAWEDRLDPNRELQTIRAREKAKEPFIWKRPDAGLPVGNCPALSKGMERGRESGGNGEEVCLGLKLPGMEVELARDSGSIGSAVFRAEENAHRRTVEKERVQKEKLKLAVKRTNKSSGNKPLFNGVYGRPVGHLTAYSNTSGGSGGEANGNGNRFAGGEYF